MQLWAIIKQIYERTFTGLDSITSIVEIIQLKIDPRSQDKTMWYVKLVRDGTGSQWKIIEKGGKIVGSSETREMAEASIQKRASWFRDKAAKAGIKLGSLRIFKRDRRGRFSR